MGWLNILKSVLLFLKGNGTNIIRIIPYTAVQFAAYEEFKKVSKKMQAGYDKQQDWKTKSDW